MTRPNLDVLKAGLVASFGVASNNVADGLSASFGRVLLALVLSGIGTRCPRFLRMGVPASV